MLLFTFQAGEQTYGLEARSIIHVAPAPACTPLPHAPVYIAGLVTWRGQTIPVIDLSALLVGTPARQLLSTRLLIMDYAQPGGGSQTLGLLAEKAVETVEMDEAQVEPQKVKIADAPYLDGTVQHAGRLIYRLSLGQLFPLSVSQFLFPKREAA